MTIAGLGLLEELGGARGSSCVGGDRDRINGRRDDESIGTRAGAEGHDLPIESNGKELAVGGKQSLDVAVDLEGPRWNPLSTAI